MAKNKTLKRRRTRISGGKTIGTNDTLRLIYKAENKEVKCDVCQSNTYKESIASLDKSKVRSGIGHFIFGDWAGIIDSTSVLLYTCTKCGMCKLIRNRGERHIVAEAI
jgi:hypothetical protein